MTLHLSAGDEAAAVRTNRFGWAQASVTVPEGSAPIAAVVHSEHLQRQMVLFRGEGRSEYHPARADIREEVALRFRIGRISRIAVDVDPPILYASNGAEARVRVRFMDSAGNLVPDEFPMLEATEGVFGSIVAAGEGVYEATYVPTESGRSRLVQITARSPSGRISMVRNLAIEPEPVARSLSVSFGGLSNFGRVNTLMGGIAFQQRLGLWDKRLLLQVGALGWSQTAEVPTSSSLDAGYFTRLTLVPIHVGLVARQEWGMVSGVWPWPVFWLLVSHLNGLGKMPVIQNYYFCRRASKRQRAFPTDLTWVNSIQSLRACSCIDLVGRAVFKSRLVGWFFWWDTGSFWTKL